MYLGQSRWETSCSLQLNDIPLSIPGHLVLRWEPDKIANRIADMCEVKLPLLEDLILQKIVASDCDLYAEGMRIASNAQVTEARIQRGFHERETILQIISDVFTVGKRVPVKHALLWMHVPRVMPNETFELDKYQVKLTASQEYRGVEIDIASVDNSDLTYEEVTAAGETLSDMLSITQGGTTAWSRIDGFDAQGRASFTDLRAPFIEFADDRPLIFGLQQFAIQTYDQIVNMSEEERAIWRDFHDYIIHACNSHYPVQFMLLYAAVEMVSGTPLILDWKKSSFASLSTEQKTQFISELDVWLHSREIEIPTDQLPSKVNQLLLRNFKPRAQALFERFEIRLPEDLLSRFNSRRNQTHNRYRYQSDDRETWSRFAGFMEKLLLSRLRYEGDFEDYSV